MNYNPNHHITYYPPSDAHLHPACQWIEKLLKQSNTSQLLSYANYLQNKTFNLNAKYDLVWISSRIRFTPHQNETYYCAVPVSLPFPSILFTSLHIWWIQSAMFIWILCFHAWILWKRRFIQADPSILHNVYGHIRWMIYRRRSWISRESKNTNAIEIPNDWIENESNYQQEIPRNHLVQFYRLIHNSGEITSQSISE